MFNDMCIDHSVLQVTIRSSIYNGIRTLSTCNNIQVQINKALLF